jgi:hypothetical protein
VIEIPLDNKIIVFKRGTEYEFRGVKPRGGHCIPNSTLGDKEASKKAQKKLKKNKTSDKINNNIPIRILSSNLCVW